MSFMIHLHHSYMLDLGDFDANILALIIPRHPAGLIMANMPDLPKQTETVDWVSCLRINSPCLLAF